MSNAVETTGSKCEWDANELSEEEWMLFAADGLAAELADEREDIYDESDGIAIPNK